MQSPDQPALSLSEWLVLCLICEKPTHGQAMASLLRQGGVLGRVWRVPKAAVYRAVERLELLGFIKTIGQEPSHQGPIRSLLEATPEGQTAARAWLSRPAVHVRDIRSELLVKLALLDRAGDDPQELLAAQHAQIVPLAAAFDDHLQSVAGFDRTLILWRYETITAAIRFLEAMS
jgi:DNA-binding PadR family transcriptional regulator